MGPIPTLKAIKTRNYTLAALFFISVALNIYAYLGRSLVLVTDVSTRFDNAVFWIGSSQVNFSGVASSLIDKKSNLKNGYQYFSGSIRRTLTDLPHLECELTNAIVINETVRIDKPFASKDRLCTVTQFDPITKIASIQSNGLIFNLGEQSATWQDKKSSGPLIPVWNYIFSI